MIKTQIKGIFQGDIILRTAVIEAFNLIRKEPWLLDIAFQSLLQDELTRATYGEKEMEEAKEWFIKTEIPISLTYRFDSLVTPLIALSLEDESEAEATLGDVHYEPQEEIVATEIVVQPEPIVGPFTPASYDSVTGYVTLPASLSTTNVFENMILFDVKANIGYVIQEVINGSTVAIAKDVRANFTKAVIAPRSSLRWLHTESIAERHSARFDIFVSSNPTHLLFLHTILKYCLYRYKQDLLEARGFERSSLGSTGVRVLNGPKESEIIYTRTINMSGYVRQYWPKELKGKIDGVIIGTDAVGMKIKDGPASPDAILPDVQNQGWQMEDDDFDGIG